MPVTKTRHNRLYDFKCGKWWIFGNKWSVHKTADMVSIGKAVGRRKEDGGISLRSKFIYLDKDYPKTLRFDLGKRLIIFEGNFHPRKDNTLDLEATPITNKRFLEFVRRNVEMLFGSHFDVTANEDRTEFRFKRKKS